MVTTASSPTPEQIKAALLDGPAARPPPGIESNLVNPTNINTALVIVLSFFLIITSSVILIRVYTKISIMKTTAYEDCKSLLYSTGTNYVYLTGLRHYCTCVGESLMNSDESLPSRIPLTRKVIFSGSYRSISPRLQIRGWVTHVGFATQRVLQPTLCLSPRPQKIVSIDISPSGLTFRVSCMGSLYALLRNLFCYSI